MKNLSEKEIGVLLNLNSALTGVRAELLKAQHGDIAIDLESQLQFIAGSLEKMIRAIETNSLSPRENRSVGLWHIVIDTWPYDSELRKKVVDAELLYDRL